MGFQLQPLTLKSEQLTSTRETVWHRPQACEQESSTQEMPQGHEQRRGLRNCVSGLGPEEETFKLGLDARRGVFPGEKGNNYSRQRERQKAWKAWHVRRMVTVYLKRKHRG